jgi:hypothetical protein
VLAGWGGGRAPRAPNDKSSPGRRSPVPVSEKVALRLDLLGEQDRFRQRALSRGLWVREWPGHLEDETWGWTWGELRM